MIGNKEEGFRYGIALFCNRLPDRFSDPGGARLTRKEAVEI